MRFLTPLAVCVASLLITTHSAEAGPIHDVAAVIHHDVDRVASWVPAKSRDLYHPDFLDRLEWVSFYEFTPGKSRGVAHLIEWNDDAAFLGLLAKAEFASKRQRPSKPEKEQPAGVPEPSTLLLMGAGAVALFRRRPLR